MNLLSFKFVCELCVCLPYYISVLYPMENVNVIQREERKISESESRGHVPMFLFPLALLHSLLTITPVLSYTCSSLTCFSVSKTLFMFPLHHSLLLTPELFY